MNIVHEEFGHGKGRLDLAQVYLKWIFMDLFDFLGG